MGYPPAGGSNFSTARNDRSSAYLEIIHVGPTIRLNDFASMFRVQNIKRRHGHRYRKIRGPVLSLIVKPVIGSLLVGDVLASLPLPMEDGRLCQARLPGPARRFPSVAYGAETDAKPARAWPQLPLTFPAENTCGHFKVTCQHCLSSSSILSPKVFSIGKSILPSLLFPSWPPSSIPSRCSSAKLADTRS